MIKREEAEMAVLMSMLTEKTPPHINFESALWGASTALLMMRKQEDAVSQYDLPCTCGHGNAYAPHHRETCPHNALYERTALEDALRYARQYWQFGNEPETQQALTVLAQAVIRGGR